MRSTIFLWQLVFKQSYRTRSLKISYTQTTRLPEYYFAELDFDEPEFPILEDLYVLPSNGDTTTGAALELPPMLKALEGRCSLKHFTVSNLPQPLILPLLSPTLRSLSLSHFEYTAPAGERWVSLLTMLKELPLLEFLHLRGGLPPQPHNMMPPEMLQKVPLILLKPVLLTELKGLTMTSPSHVFPAALLLRNLPMQPSCSVGGVLGELHPSRMSGQLTYLAQSLANKLVAQGKGSPATPYITLMVDAPKITDITTPNACVFCWATVEPVPPEPSFGTFPQALMRRPRDFQLDLHDLTLLEVLVDLVPHLPLAALDTLSLGVYPSHFLPPQHARDHTLPAAACIRIVFAPATHVCTLVMRGRMSENLPALVAPSFVDVDADTAAAGLLFPRLKVLSFHEADFLEEALEDDRPRRGAWWGAFTDALRAREKADPALRLEKIVVKDAGGVTKLEVGSLQEFADEVVWDGWRGDDLESLGDEDEDFEAADED